MPKEFNHLLLISIGAISGALIRWQLDNNSLVNICGCAVFGFVMGLPLRKRSRLIICSGFCGAMTTFSGWMVDSIALFHGGSIILALRLIIYTFLLGFIASAFGFFIGTNLKKLKLFLFRLLSSHY